MPIIRSEETKTLVLLDKRILSNPRLSLEATGAYAIIEAGISEPAVFSKEIIYELTCVGYLKEVADE